MVNIRSSKEAYRTQGFICEQFGQFALLMVKQIPMCVDFALSLDLVVTRTQVHNKRNAVRDDPHYSVNNKVQFRKCKIID